MSYQSVVAAESGLLRYWKMENASGDDTDIVASHTLTKGAGQTPGTAGNASWTGLGSATCWAFTASGNPAQALALDLSARSVITVEFIASMVSYTNTQQHFVEHSPNWTANNGFNIDADRVNGFYLVGNLDHTGNFSWSDHCTRPSAAWHHHLLVMDRTHNAAASKMYIDGVAQTLTTETHTDTSAALNFPNDDLFVGGRKTGLGMLIGNMGQLAIYTGDKSSVAATHFAALTASAPVADFTGTPTTGTRPLSVAFTDASTNTPTSWLWEKSSDGGSTWSNFSGSPTSQNPTESFQ